MKLLKFSAVWCPGCLVMKKVWKEVIEENPNITIEEYDYDMDEDEVIKYNVGEKLPVVIMVDDMENEIKRLTGEKTKEEITCFIKE